MTTVAVAGWFYAVLFLVSWQRERRAQRRLIAEVTKLAEEALAILKEGTARSRGLGLSTPPDSNDPA